MGHDNSRREPRLTLQSLRVLSLLARNPGELLSGSDIRKETGIASGTLYPILLRMEDAGWLRGDWEKVDPSVVGRPRKRFYRITISGQKIASRSFQIFDAEQPV